MHFLQWIRTNFAQMMNRLFGSSESNDDSSSTQDYERDEHTWW